MQGGPEPEGAEPVYPWRLRGTYRPRRGAFYGIGTYSQRRHYAGSNAPGLSNDDVVFVSIHSLHKVSKYKGKEGEAPRLNKLGTGAWEKLKDRTKTKIKDIARDLIKLYSQRREEKGFQYSPDSFLQRELEASFIYEDTPDQSKATAT